MNPPFIAASVTETMINWKRRQFYHDSADKCHVCGSEVGFTGRAGRVIINDPYRLPQFEAAREPRALVDDMAGGRR